MQMLAFNALELPGQSVLDDAAREYQALVGVGAQSGLTTASSVRLAELLAVAAALVAAVVLVLGLRRHGVCRGTTRRARPHEWSTMLETLPDAPSEGSRAAAVVHDAMVELAPGAAQGQAPSTKASAPIDTDAGEESYDAVD